MRRYLNWFLNGFAITFAVPSFLIIISWNAIPGDKLYGIKTGLENIALGITIKTPIASILSVKYTERRFSEANALLSKKGSTLGYTLLVNEAKESTKILKDKKDKGQAKELVKKIDEYKKQISQKKAAIETGQIDIPVSGIPQTAPVPGQKPPQQTPNPTPNTDNPQPENNINDVIVVLDNTTDELQEVEDDLKKNLGASLHNIISQSPIPTPLDLTSPNPTDSGRGRVEIIIPSPTETTSTPKVEATPVASPTP